MRHGLRARFYIGGSGLRRFTTRILCTVGGAGLLAGGIVALTPAVAANAQVSGAVFTTTNPGVDNNNVTGLPQLCLNGNPGTSGPNFVPAINCNLYPSKSYVWLSGGPGPSALAAGTYFFAVLVPGGQHDPNDGAKDNLSDTTLAPEASGYVNSDTSTAPSGDAYTNRTFTANGIGGVSYIGTHTFQNNEIRLMPYDDTTNPGGVYIMAVCSLSNGYPVDPRSCKYDAFKVQAGAPGGCVGDDCPGSSPASGPTITKDADGAFTDTWTWSTHKSALPATVKQIGGSATFNYTVTVTHDNGTISGITISGTIDVFQGTDHNGTPFSTGITSVTDALSGAVTQACTVTDGGAQTLTQNDTSFAYTCSIVGSTLPVGEVDNTATVTWPDQTLNGDSLTAGSAQFVFSSVPFDNESDVNKCVTVTDTFNAGAPDTLGDACADGTASNLNNTLTNFHESYDGTSTFTFTYSRSILVPVNNCLSYANSALATSDSNITTTFGPATATVTVCGPANTGALTIGFWKTTNGQSLITNYCAGTSGTTLATYLAGLGAGTGPFKNAAGLTCSNLAKYIQNVLTGANSTNMNVMLGAQMLGTALDVYYSTSSLGCTSTTSGKIKPPSNFFTCSAGGLGAFNMDMTAICPMVDNTTLGTATCSGSKPSTNAYASGAVPAAAMTVQQILNYEAYTTSQNDPDFGVYGAFSGTPYSSTGTTGTSNNPAWYGTNRTLQEIAKNIFDQINNRDAFAA